MHKACLHALLVQLQEQEVQSPAVSSLEMVQKMYDFRLEEWREPVRTRLTQLSATSSTPLTQAVQWNTQPSAWDCEDLVVQTHAIKE